MSQKQQAQILFRSPETKEMKKQEVDDLFLEHIADFIKQQEKEEAPSGQQLVTTTGSDPFTGTVYNQYLQPGGWKN